MKVSARNVFRGKISAVVNGAVNAEIELMTAGGDRIVAIVTEDSVKLLGLAVGQEALAYVKAPWVMVLTGESDVRFSARNQLRGKVVALVPGTVNTEVGIQLPGGTVVHAMLTNEAIADMELKLGADATALIKASHVILGVPS